MVSKFDSSRFEKPVFSAKQYDAEKSLAFWLVLLTALVGLAAGIAFIVFPELDFYLVSFLSDENGFLLRGSDAWSFVRTFTMWAYGAVYLAMVIGLYLSWHSGKAVWSLYPVQWLYLVASSLVGPLLVTNLVLKTYIGRPRPRSVVEYGGDLDFVPVFQAGGKCVDNCSFVSGEVSSMVMIFAALMLASVKWRWLFALMLLPAWAFSAFLRIGQGAHFPSDTFFAGIFMIVIAAGLYRFIVLSPRNVIVQNQ